MSSPSSMFDHHCVLCHDSNTSEIAWFMNIQSNKLLGGTASDGTSFWTTESNGQFEWFQWLIVSEEQYMLVWERVLIVYIYSI